MGHIKSNPVFHPALTIEGSAGSWVPFIFPEGTTAFSVSSLTDVEYRVSHIVDGTDSQLKDDGGEWFEDGVMLMGNKKLYFISGTGSGHDLEIQTWQ